MTSKGPAAFSGVVCATGARDWGILRFITFRSCIVFYMSMNFILLSPFALLKQRSASAFLLASFYVQFLPRDAMLARYICRRHVLREIPRSPNSQISGLLPFQGP